MKMKCNICVIGLGWAFWAVALNHLCGFHAQASDSAGFMWTQQCGIVIILSIHNVPYYVFGFLLRPAIYLGVTALEGLEV